MILSPKTCQRRKAGCRWSPNALIAPVEPPAYTSTCKGEDSKDSLWWQKEREQSCERRKFLARIVVRNRTPPKNTKQLAGCGQVDPTPVAWH